MKKIHLICVMSCLWTISVCGLTFGEDIAVREAPKNMSKAAVDLRAEIRGLFEARTRLMRSYIVSAMNDTKEAAAEKDELIRNANDLGGSIQPYYGYLAKNIMAGLLKKDVVITGDVIRAARSKKAKDIDRAKKKWYANAYLLAGFFALARNQSMGDLTDMLYKHLDLTWGEIQAIVDKDEAKSLEYFGEDSSHMVMFSEVLADGIVRQFPEKFKL
ncbi:MAG: hypothetical protein HQL30_11655 [Candidatus Omnitrophica bacterium]|nr:hypothetical protein [Candidatus Omnitrophota bacterium]